MLREKFSLTIDSSAPMIDVDLGRPFDEVYLGAKEITFEIKADGQPVLTMTSCHMEVQAPGFEAVKEMVERANSSERMRALLRQVKDAVYEYQLGDDLASAIDEALA